MIQVHLNPGDKVGLDGLPIANPSADWTEFLPTYEPQRFAYDTNECSQLGGTINPLETYFNMLKKYNKLSNAFLTFCTLNGYFDANGSFAFSERFTAILDGTSINGNTIENGWKCVQKYGLLPRSKLNWTLADAAHFPNQALMDTSYYNPTAVTQEMLNLAKQFKNYCSVSWGWVVDPTLKTSIPLYKIHSALQTSPIGLAVPTPVPISLWNQQTVLYTGGTGLDHCVMGYKIDPTNVYPTFFADQYQPWLKQFSLNYYIPVGIVFYVSLA